ncbi:hypothetical protein COC42_16635 [Sphingomonas spermidinifaciens]|uniref:CpsD/CapB family tyrosine-protein kinase n=1 Tax=Sphingomonas spermidinifaciens TaxID=1141889 RepID=A0A2A4B1X3_9SPHN|nr:hypothetical protein [Sphingomonas spermidinifaciens]PCD01738.1 hypothetical protein COC42_16635 [Sphingomonas spermidinifaciens]
MRIRSSAAGGADHAANPAFGAPGRDGARVTPGVRSAPQMAPRPELIALHELGSPDALKIRALRDTLLSTFSDRPHGRVQSWVLVGIDCEAELAVLAANLAIVLARLGTPTLLIDGAFERPMIDHLFGMPAEAGLVNHYDGSAAMLAAYPGPVEGLSVMPAGEQAPAAAHLLEQAPMLDMIERWPIQAELAILSLPISSMSFAQTIRGFDGAVIVAKKHRATVADTRRAVDVLDSERVTAAATVLV